MVAGILTDRANGTSLKSWVYELLARFREGGYEALTRRSRRPRSCSHQVDSALRAAIVERGRELGLAGLDSGAATIAHHLALAFDHVTLVATILRILSREGLIAPQPQKRPRSSFIRFAASGMAATRHSV